MSSAPNSTRSASQRARRRRGSSLGEDPRGDTGGKALATMDLKQKTPPRESPAPHTKERGRKRKKVRSLLSRSKRAALKHTWLVPLVLVLTILALYFISPGEHNPLHSAIFLSYANPALEYRTNTLPKHIGDVTQYAKGKKDFAFFGFYTIVLSFTREFLMQRLIRPLAIRLGIRGKDKLARFMEQAYTAIYFAIFGPFGVYIMSRTPVWYFNTQGMYEGFPHRALEGYFKAYYLLQASYWAQQGLVLLLQLEKPRKDFRELVLHHIITLALIAVSYRFHFTYIGLAVYITHDISDFFLATSKCLNYLDSPIIEPYFASFILIWAYLRHWTNFRLIYSMIPFRIPFFPGQPNEFKTVGPYAPTWADVDWDNQQYKGFTAHWIGLPMLVSLQLVNLFWFFLILRILYRILFKGIVKDERSEYEDDEVEEEAKVNGKTNGVMPQLVINGKPIENGLEVHENGRAGGNAEANERMATLRKR